jgi:hypothetical protein
MDGFSGTFRTTSLAESAEEKALKMSDDFVVAVGEEEEE